MCGRFTMRAPGKLLAQTFQLDQVPELPFRYNIAPTQSVATVRQPGGKRELAVLRWGLVPSWAKDPAIGNRLINARADTVAEKPSFRAAFKYRRCLLAADGFYEWRAANGKKQPYHIRLRDGGPFGIAGLWEHWEGEDGEVIESCALLTTDANAVVRPVHDRMPVIIEPADYDLWLDPAVQSPDRIKPLLRPYRDEAMEAGPVSLHVNNARNDDPRCVETVAV